MFVCLFLCTRIALGRTHTRTRTHKTHTQTHTETHTQTLHPLKTLKIPRIRRANGKQRDRNSGEASGFGLTRNRARGRTSPGGYRCTGSELAVCPKHTRMPRPNLFPRFLCYHTATTLPLRLPYPLCQGIPLLPTSLLIPVVQIPRRAVRPLRLTTSMLARGKTLFLLMWTIKWV